MGDWTHSISKEDDATRDFAHHLGYAILNCGTIENLTYSYAATLGGTHFFGTGLARKLFSQRKKLVIASLRKANLGDDLSDRAIELWGETTDIMDIRNVVAHNPINRVEVKSDRGDEKHQLLGVVDMASSTPTNIKSLDATKIANLANLASDLAHRLEGCLIDIQRSQLADS